MAAAFLSRKKLYIFGVRTEPVLAASSTDEKCPPPVIPLTPAISAVTRSDTGSTAVPGVTPLVLYQLVTCTLKRSPLMTFSVIPGPILLPPVIPLTLAAKAFGLVVLSVGYPAGKAVRVSSTLL